MNNKVIIKLIKKSSLTYVAILILFILIKKYWSGGGKGRIESHFSISWEAVLSNLPFYAIGALFICYPFFYVYYKEAKKNK